MNAELRTGARRQSAGWRQSSSPGGTSKTTSQLQTPTGCTGIYANWNVNVDGATGNDDPWDFGAASRYPILEYGTLLPASEQGR